VPLLYEEIEEIEAIVTPLLVCPETMANVIEPFR
jgi:hypothetical protein